MSRRGPGPVASVPLSPALRVATGAAGAAALLAVLVSAVAPAPAVLALLLLQALATVPRLRERLPAAAVRVAPWGVIGAGVAIGAGVGLTSTAGLALLACATVVGHHVLVSTPRDVGVSLLTTGGTCLLVVSQGSSLAVVPALALAWTAGAAALALRLVEARPRSAGRGAPAWAAVLRRLAWPVSASLLAVLVVGLLGVQPPSAAQRLAGAGGAGADAPRTGRSTAAYVSGRLDLRVRGELPRTPVVEVPASSDRLWRAGVLGEYDGVAWSPAAVARPPSTTADPLGLGDGDPAADGATGAERSDDVTVLGDLGGLVLAPGHLVAVASPSGPARVEVLGQSVHGRGGDLAAAYRVGSRAAPDARAVDGGGPGALPGDPDDAVWTSLPPSVTQRTRTLAREVTAGASTRGEVVAAVEDHLRGTYAYDLGSAVPPPGQDAVDHFLFDARSGFCEQFAAAEVVLLRSLGIPARMATGFSGGEDRGERRLVRADAAHAWVEVWQPGTGWAPSDPTPAGAASTGLADRLAALLADQDVRRGLAGALVLLFVVALLVAARRRRPGGPRTAPATAGGPPVIAAAERLLVALDRAGRPSSPGETVASVAGRVPEVAGALEVVQRVAYADRSPGTRDQLEAEAALDGTTARLLAEERASRRT